MNIVLRQAKIIDPSSPFHQQQADISIVNGIITAIEPSSSSTADTVVETEGLTVSPGWVDLFANFCDPGFEYKETLETGVLAAAAGGYTDVMIVPNTAPVLHNKAGVEYVTQKNAQSPVTIHPIGAVTRNAEGKELAEMYDMHQSGAAAFSDGLQPVQSSGVLLKALQYVQAIDKTIIQLPDDKAIHPHGLMNEGVVSTQLGLAGKPAIAEEVMIARDIELVKYTGSKLHFTGVSTQKGMELIQAAKEAGIKVTCSVTPYHLYFCDEDLGEYDSNLKVNPPLRTKKDRDFLRQAVLNGWADCIASHHLPQNTDSKMVEFEYAKFGMIGLQTAFAVVKSCVPQLSLEQWIELCSLHPRRIFGLPPATIAIDQPACLSLFLPEEKWTVELKQLFSKSRNTPFVGKQLTGKPLGIINKDSLFLSPQ